MTIARSLNTAALSNDLTDFEDGARAAPEGMHEDAKALSEIFSEVFFFLKAELDAADIGVALPNDDRYREFAAVMYGMLRDGNPNTPLFADAERFGRALAGPAGARVLRQAGSDLGALRAMGIVPPAQTTGAVNFG